MMFGVVVWILSMCFNYYIFFKEENLLLKVDWGRELQYCFTHSLKKYINSL